MTSNNNTNNNANTTLQLPQRPGEADCRDFLRTGRCKYGDSCKYHHPSNVMSGGGIKGPIDPNEPLFPIRPDEQVCQYYMKHGTCKFGQTCKFHHPIHFLKTAQMQCLPAGTSQQLLSPSQQQTTSQQSQLSSTSIVNGNSNHHESVVVTAINGNGGGIPNNNNNNNNSNGIHTVMSANDFFLPQRPGEQDCIYFLRNGRCKYGASCKYHHPRVRGRSVSAGSIPEATGMLNFQVLPSHQFPHHNSSNKLFSIPSSQLNSSQQIQQQQQQQATHILLSDGPIALMTVNTHPNYNTNNMSNNNGNINNNNMNNNMNNNGNISNNNMNNNGNMNNNPINSGNMNNNNNNIPFYRQESDSILPPNQRTPYPSMNSLDNHQMSPNLKNDGNDWSSRTNNNNNMNTTNNIHRIQSYEDDNISEMQNNFYHNTRRFPPPPNRPPNSFNMHNDEIRMRLPPHKNRLQMGSEIHKRWGSHMSLPSSNNLEVKNNVQERNSNSVQHSSQVSQTLSSSAPSHIGRNYLIEYGNQRLSHSQSFASNAAAAHQEKDQGRKMDDGLSMMTSALLTMLDTPDDKGKTIKEEYEGLPTASIDMDHSSHIISGVSIHNMDQSFSGGMHVNNSSHTATLDNKRTSYNNLNPLYSDEQHHQYNGIIRNTPNNSVLYNDRNSNNSHNTLMTENPRQYRPRSESLPIRRNDSRDLNPRETGRWSPSWRHGYSDNSGHNMERNAQSVAALQNSQTHATPKIGLFLS